MRKQNWELGARYGLPKDLSIRTQVRSEKDLVKLLAGGNAELSEDLAVNNSIVITSTATLNLANNTVTNESELWNSEVWSVISIDGGTLTIEGDGSIIGKENDCYAIDVKNGGQVIINSGNFVGNVSAVYVTEGSVIINGGHFEIQQLSQFGDYRYLLNCLDKSYNEGKASITVYGGEFVNFNPANNTSEGPNTNYVAEGYKVVENSGVYTVMVKEDKEFLEQIANGGNIQLTSDVTLTDTAIIESVATINLNNQVIKSGNFEYVNGDVANGDTDSYVFWVKDGGNLTIEGNGEVIANDAIYSMAVWAQGGIVTIKDGKFYNNGEGSDLIYASAGGKVYIYGGEFHPNEKISDDVPGTADKCVALNIKDADRAISEIKVYGGKFYNFNPENNASEGKGTNFVANGYKAVEIETDVWEVIKA